MRFTRGKGFRNTEPCLLFRIYCLINRHFTTSLYQGKKIGERGTSKGLAKIFFGQFLRCGKRFGGLHF
jgi:hypothetical protein